MVQKILEVCLSETQASGNREYVQKIFHPIPNAKAAVDKESKEVIKKVHKTTKRKLHFASLMDMNL